MSATVPANIALKDRAVHPFFLLALLQSNTRTEKGMTIGDMSGALGDIRLKLPNMHIHQPGLPTCMCRQCDAAMHPLHACSHTHLGAAAGRRVHPCATTMRHQTQRCNHGSEQHRDSTNLTCLPCAALPLPMPMRPVSDVVFQFIKGATASSKVDYIQVCPWPIQHREGSHNAGRAHKRQAGLTPRMRLGILISMQGV